MCQVASRYASHKHTNRRPRTNSSDTRHYGRGKWHTKTNGPENHGAEGEPPAPRTYASWANTKKRREAWSEQTSQRRYQD